LSSTTVDDLQHRGQPVGELVPIGDLERDVRRGEGPFGPDDALGHGRLRDKEGACDLGGRQAPEQAQRQRDPGLGREDRVAGGDDEAEQVVFDPIVDRGVEIGRFAALPALEVATDLLLLSLESPPAPHPVDRAVPGGGHEPGARVVRDA